MATRSTPDMNAVMETLARSRPVFYSESDFKHSISWQIQKDHPAMRVRQEVGNLLPGPTGGMWISGSLTPEPPSSSST